MAASCGDISAPVHMAEGSRNMFASGTWDATGQLVAQIDQIRATAANLPYVTWGQAIAKSL